MVILNYLNEIWKDIPELEGQYQASNYGRIKSLNYHRTGKEQILKLTKSNSGYLQVCLYKNGKRKCFLVHRLVWLAFHGAIPEGMQINHKSEVKTDNRLENLELVTPKENLNWGTCQKRRSKKRNKSVFQYDLEGNLINKWCSLIEIERQLGYANGNISYCCSGKYKTAYNYIWKYKNEDNCLPS